MTVIRLFKDCYMNATRMLYASLSGYQSIFPRIIRTIGIHRLVNAPILH